MRPAITTPAKAYFPIFRCGSTTSMLSSTPIPESPAAMSESSRDGRPR